jgi:hypothetical protein
MRKDRHLFFEILALALWTPRFAASHYQGFKRLAAGTTDKIK